MNRADAADPPFVFRDIAKAARMQDSLRGMMGHAAAWGDVDGDGWIDLFVGTFADRRAELYQAGGAAGPVPNRLLLNRNGRFVHSRQKGLAHPGRASGSVFADFDNDGKLDLYVANNGRINALAADDDRLSIGRDRHREAEEVAGRGVAGGQFVEFQEAAGRKQRAIFQRFVCRCVIAMRPAPR